MKYITNIPSEIGLYNLVIPPHDSIGRIPDKQGIILLGRREGKKNIGQNGKYIPLFLCVGDRERTRLHGQRGR